MILLPPALQRLLSGTQELRQAYLVGGCVRDALLGNPCKDFDIEVFGLSYEQLVNALSRWGRTDLVGRSFGVVKLTVQDGMTFDFTIPRRDSKTAPGHKGFQIEFDPALDPKDAAARRDFTINSLMYDPRAKRLLDFFGGEADLRNRILRHTSLAFTEDPLRVLRGMQFASRFDLETAPETVALCRKIKSSFGELAVERVREEWFKWAEISVRPSRGLKFLVDTEWIEHFPEIKSLIGTPQEPEWHPEGDVFIHTCHCCDSMANLPEWQTANVESRIVYMLAILAHDFGKPPTTYRSTKDGETRIVSPGHEDAGVAPTENFLFRINAPLVIRERIVPLVANHLAHLQTETDRAIRRLAKRLEPETIEGLCIVMTADSMGRPPRPAVVPESVKALLARAHELQIQSSAPKPILQGRHLLELRMSPGPELGPILREAFDAQLEGKFFDLPQALRWLCEQKNLQLSSTIHEQLNEKLDSVRSLTEANEGNKEDGGEQHLSK